MYMYLCINIKYVTFYLFNNLKLYCTMYLCMMYLIIYFVIFDVFIFQIVFLMND